jgi:hypothetical protein
MDVLLNIGGDLIVPQLTTQVYATSLTRRGCVMLHHNNHSYTKSKVGKRIEGENFVKFKSSSWLCKHRKYCNGRIHCDIILAGNGNPLYETLQTIKFYPNIHLQHQN